MAEKEVKTKMVMNLLGHVFFVKTSGPLCGKKFTIKHNGKKGTVIGEGPSEKEEEDIWVSFDGDNGKVCTLKDWEEIVLA